MKKILLPLLCLAAFILSGPPDAPLRAEPPAPEPAPPEPEKTWRVALVSSGPYKDYQLIFQGLMNGLYEQGIIENGNVPLAAGEEMEPMWAWAAAQAGGRRLEFVKDAFYSADFKRERREPLKQRLRQRLREKGDIDLILAFGTGAGQDLAGENLGRPVLVSAASNAVEAGIIPSPDDSGRDDLWASIEPGRHERQLRLFHSIFGFSSLGLAYDDSPSARSGISLGAIEKTARDLGVELVRCTAEMEIPDVELAADRLRECYRQLAERQVEAVYLAASPGMIPGRIPEIIAPLIQARIPTFSQSGPDEVASGALLSAGQDDYLDIGRFSAAALAEVLRGRKPRSIPQRYESSPSLAVNLRTALLIGWNLPMEILVAVDQFYEDF